MLNIGGELAFILQDIDYSSKKDLLEKLRAIRSDLKNYTQAEKEVIQPILAVTIQQAFYASGWELMRYKDFLSWRNSNVQKDKDTN